MLLCPQKAIVHIFSAGRFLPLAANLALIKKSADAAKPLKKQLTALAMTKFPYLCAAMLFRASGGAEALMFQTGLLDLFSGVIKRLQAANFMLHFVDPAF
jgi:hypothetical protein